MMEDLNKHPLVLRYRKAQEYIGREDVLNSDLALRLMRHIVGEEDEIMACDIWKLCMSQKEIGKVGNFRYNFYGKKNKLNRISLANRISFRDLNIEVEYYEPDYIDDEYHHSYWRWVRKSEEDLTLLMLSGK